MVGAGKTKVFQTTRAPMNSFGSMGALKLGDFPKMAVKKLAGAFFLHAPQARRKIF